MDNKKSSGANLDKRRGIFIKTGVIISMVLVLMAFEYKIFERPTGPVYQGRHEVVVTELIPVTIPKPPPPPLPPSQEVVLAPDESEIDDSKFVIDVDAHPGIEVPDYDFSKFQIEEEIIPEDEVFIRPEIMPEFPGGIRALYEFLASKLKYPSSARDVGVEGTVFVGFVIEKDGSVSNVHLLRGIGAGCNEEAMRVVEAMPPWIPGRMGTQAVRVSYSLPIRFQLQK